MKYLCFGFLFLIFFLAPSSLVRGQVDFAITSPEAGSAVQGKVEIKGYVKATDFAGYELDFSNASSTGSGWFPIQASDQNPTDGSLGFWDTNSITDGNYRIRLTVHYKNAGQAEVYVEDIRVRNYSPMETNTPAAGSTAIPPQVISAKPTFQIPESHAGRTVRNDIEIGRTDLLFTVAISIAVGFVLAFLLTYLFIKRNK